MIGEQTEWVRQDGFCDEEHGQAGTPPMKSHQPALPAYRAIVVQLHADAQVAQGEFRGRVEHIVSYKATHFHSLEELVAFLTKTILSLAVEEEEP
jgi:hypothetical protein